jgi:hypothetical protein
LATEEAILFLAGRASTAEGASDEKRDADRCESDRDPSSQGVKPNHERVQFQGDHTTHLHSLKTDESFCGLPASEPSAHKYPIVFGQWKGEN